MINAIFKIGYGENGAEHAAEHLFAKQHEPMLAIRNSEKSGTIEVVRVFYSAAMRKLFSWYDW